MTPSSRALEKVLFLCPTGELGGAERSLLDLISSMAVARPALQLVLVAGAAGPFTQEARRRGVSVRLAPLPEAAAGMGDSALAFEGRARATLSLALRAGPAAMAAGRYARHLSGLIVAEAPSVVHSNALKLHILSALSRCPAPIVWHLRDFIGSRRLVRVALRGLASRAAGAIAISEAVARDARPFLRRLPIDVVHNAVDTEQFAPGPGDPGMLDRLAGLPDAGGPIVRVGLVATFARWKGQDLFLEAARAAADRLAMPTRFYIVGGPIYATQGSQFTLEELRRRADRTGLAGKVGFVPFQRDTAPIYRALDLVVHASTRPEPFGRTIVEAMACARPVVAVSSGGAAELFTSDDDAVGVKAPDPVELAAAIVDLAGSPGKRRRLGERGRLTALSRFSHHRLGPQVLEIYERLVGPGGQRDRIRA